jgi:hypothetical protein
MQLKHGLIAAAMMVAFVSLAPPSRADIVANNSAGVATAMVIGESTVIGGPTVIDGFKGDPMPGIGASSTDRDEAGVGDPAPGPGLLLFAVTAFAYLWFWKPKPRGSQKSETATLA